MTRNFRRLLRRNLIQGHDISEQDLSSVIEMIEKLIQT